MHVTLNELWQRRSRNSLELQSVTVANPSQCHTHDWQPPGSPDIGTSPRFVRPRTATGWGMTIRSLSPTCTTSPFVSRMCWLGPTHFQRLLTTTYIQALYGQPQLSRESIENSANIGGQGNSGGPLAFETAMLLVPRTLKLPSTPDSVHTHSPASSWANPPAQECLSDRLGYGRML
jgi:hypothetical protein